MCGIAGFVDWADPMERPLPELQAMVDGMTCRGPDAEGYWQAPYVAFGHRRLVVVDPQGGGQPMVRRVRGRLYSMVYNGELYNTDELRAELEGLGYALSSRSDTEVLLMAYVAWGERCLERLNGIFAFAVWDQSRRSLFMARDRLGVKPLFYWCKQHRLIFGSELKALLAHPAVEHRLTEEGLAEVVAIGPARTPGQGLFADCHELRAGHALTFQGAGIKVWPYWRLLSQPHEDDLDATANRVRALFTDTVVRQLVSDVPLGTLLSGGLDSSAVTAVAATEYARRGLEPLRTYSVDFVDQERYFRAGRFQTNLDAPWVERMVDVLGTRHRAVLLDTPELVEHLEWALVARDHPGMADVDTSLLLFCREIKKDVTVALSGEAADEVFGGYPWFHLPEAIWADTFPWARRLDERIALFSAEVVEAVKPKQYVARRYREALSEVPTLAGEQGLQKRMREMSYLNITRFLPTLLDRKDRMSMAVGLEVRVPFCDHRLVEYVFNIPWALKVHRNTAKGILRQALTGILPDDVLWRQKSPYPSTHHPTYAKAYRGAMLELLSDHTQPIYPLLNRETVRALTQEGAEPIDLPFFGQLMGVPQIFAYLVQFNTWLSRYRISLT